VVVSRVCFCSGIVGSDASSVAGFSGEAEITAAAYDDVDDGIRDESEWKFAAAANALAVRVIADDDVPDSAGDEIEVDEGVVTGPRVGEVTAAALAVERYDDDDDDNDDDDVVGGATDVEEEGDEDLALF
jgi:hypothetical protein